MLGDLLARSHGNHFVDSYRIGQYREIGQAIGQQMDAGCQRLVAPGVQPFMRERHGIKANIEGAAILRYFNRSDEGQIPPALACTGTAQVGIVNLDANIQYPPIFRTFHNRQQLVFDELGGTIAHSQMMLQRQRRDVVLRASDEEQGHEPDRQRQFGVLEDLAGRQACLTPTAAALPDSMAVPLKNRVPGISTTRTNETLLQRADAAMYAVKLSGRDAVRLFNA